ncbi:hypothetical protein BJ912DRAFT_934126 [Pholiota molesta]|nr:hypothetical protein BJ912DRAFT_934126 [Pholiota molesta]
MSLVQFSRGDFAIGGVVETVGTCCRTAAEVAGGSAGQKKYLRLEGNRVDTGNPSHRLIDGKCRTDIGIDEVFPFVAFEGDRLVINIHEFTKSAGHLLSIVTLKIDRSGEEGYWIGLGGSFAKRFGNDTWLCSIGWEKQDVSDDGCAGIGQRRRGDYRLDSEWWGQLAVKPSQAQARMVADSRLNLLVNYLISIPNRFVIHCPVYDESRLPKRSVVDIWSLTDDLPVYLCGAANIHHWSPASTIFGRGVAVFPLPQPEAGSCVDPLALCPPIQVMEVLWLLHLR